MPHSREDVAAVGDYGSDGAASTILGRSSSWWWGAALGFTLVAGGLWAFFALVGRPALRLTNALGQMTVSRQALEAMVNRTARRLDGVERVFATVLPASNRVRVKVRVEACPAAEGKDTLRRLVDVLHKWFSEALDLGPDRVTVEIAPWRSHDSEWR